MVYKVKETIKKYDMISQGDIVYVAVSGGADSICLLLVLNSIKDEFGFELGVIHVEHGIRGLESEDDAEFVSKLCDSLEIECTIFSVDAIKYSEENKVSLEEAARILRYDAFDKSGDGVKIAIAHNLEDNVETMLFNMLRGTGLDGASGIRPVRDNYIRPLINVSRNEILEYLNEVEADFRIDSTNLEDEYSRNYIRHNILPLFKHVNDKSIEHMNALSNEISKVFLYINKEVNRCFLKYVKDDCIFKEILAEDEVIIKEVIHQFISNKAKTSKDIMASHIEIVYDILKNGGGRKAHLPYNMEVVSQYDKICIRFREDESVNKSIEEVFVDLEEIDNEYEIEISNGNKIIFEVYDYDESLEISEKTYTKMFDYDKIDKSVCIRSRQEGDYFVVDKKGSKKTIKKYMIDEKIPKEKREEVIVLSDSSHVIWLVGYRISEKYKISSDTKRILKVTVGELNERKS